MDTEREEARRQRVSFDARTRPVCPAGLRPGKPADDAERGCRGDQALAGCGAALSQHAGEARLCRQAPQTIPAAPGSHEFRLRLSRLHEPGRDRAAPSAGCAGRDGRQLLTRGAERLRHSLSSSMSRRTAWCASPPASARGSPPMQPHSEGPCSPSKAKTCARTISTPASCTLTEHTVTSKAELRRVLNEVRKIGYAATQDELDYGLVSLAVPILDESGRALAAINCSTSTSRVSKEELVRTRLPVLQNAARHIESALRRQPYLLRSVHPG